MSELTEEPIVKKQSKKMSAIETVINVGSGYILALVIQATVFPWFGIITSIAEDLSIAAIFTIASLIRSYFIRRIFENLHVLKLRSHYGK